MITETNKETFAVLNNYINESFYKHLFEELPFGYAFLKVIYDIGGKPYDYEFKEVNTIFKEKIGVSNESLIGRRLSKILRNLEKCEIDKLNHYAKKTINDGKQEFELCYSYLNKWYRVNFYSTERNYIIMFFIEITNEKRQLLELEQSRRRMENIIEGTNAGTWELNLETGEYCYNDRWAEMLGYSLDELRPLDKNTWMKLVHPEDLKCQLGRDKKLYSKDIEYYDEEYRMVHKNGSFVWIQDRGKVISWSKDGKPLIVSGTHTDITEKKKKQQEIVYLSYCDQLTGLYNRRCFEKTLKEIDTEENLPITLVMADVNGLKLVNDSFGHKLGDELLKKVADILKKGCRKTDIVARLGGDEFIVILTRTSLSQGAQIIKKINFMTSKEKVGAIDVSISFGYETKTTMKQNIHNVFKKAEDYMYRHKLYESASIRNDTINLIMNTLYEKSDREMLHSKRVSELCELLAIRMNFDKESTNQIKIAGLMHDIGKMGVDENILNKPQKLNDAEYNEIRRHPEIGYRILSSSNNFSEIAEYVLKHHERWDGKGYPGGFQGEEISLQARIITIVDSFDAMTSDRPYRKAMSVSDALKEIRRCSGTQFDPIITDLFIDMVCEQNTNL